jgi:dTDP-glucose 4,6-dehydratase
MKRILVTGAAGFIGSNFVEIALSQGHSVISYDALTYAGNLENLEEFSENSKHVFVQGLIQDQALISKLLVEHQIDWLVNFAAESHVDKSISGPAPFIDTNINGTFALLTSAKTYYESLDGLKKDQFRYVQISTDEVFGTLNKTGRFSETSPYQPNSPYSSSKGAGDLLVRAWFHTYKLPVITTNCSNNYGPKQFPEKLIPHMLLRALAGETLPVYGKGENIRDWIHVKDHALGILAALEKGKPGETYCFGGDSERTNLTVVKAICAELDRIKPRIDGSKYENQITFVTDRPGHDFRYAIDDSKAQKELGYSRKYEDFEDGLKDTIRWYLSHMDWSKKVLSKPGVKIIYDWNALNK